MAYSGVFDDVWCILETYLYQQTYQEHHSIIQQKKAVKIYEIVTL